MTKQRKVVYEIVSSSKNHMTAEEIYEKAKKILPNIAIGTIYRNLSFLTSDKKIRRIPVPDSADRYDGLLISHEHLMCESCGSLTDIELKGLREFLENASGVKLTGYELILKNICNKCEKEEIK